MLGISKDIKRLKHLKKIAIRGEGKSAPCAKEIRSMVEDLFTKFMSVDTQWDAPLVLNANIQDLATIVYWLARHTSEEEKLSNEELEYIVEIFNDLIALYYEAITNSQIDGKCNTDLRAKIEIIRYIVYENLCVSNQYHENVKIFESFKSLYKILHRINAEWHELSSRCSIRSIFYHYRNAYEREVQMGRKESEDKKLQKFMGLLDGEKKFVPIYEYKAVGYEVVDHDYEAFIHNTIETEYDQPYIIPRKRENN